MKSNVSGPTGTSVPPRADRRSSRWDEHRAGRREELIQATIKAVRRHGAGVGMDQIAAVAQTSKAVIYRYFADKADLYRAVGQRVAEELVTELGASTKSARSPRMMLAQGVDAYLRVLDESPELYRFVVHPTLDQQAVGEEVVADYTGRIGALITGLLRGWLEDVGHDPSAAEPWGVAVVGFVRAAGDWWLENPRAMTRTQLAEYLTTLLWTGAEALLRNEEMP